MPMDHSRTARSVPGEIMTAPRAASRAKVPDADIIDADFEVVAADRLVPPRGRAGIASAEPPQAAVPGMSFLKKQPAAHAGTSAAGSGFAIWTLGAGLALVGVWVLGGHTFLGGGDDALNGRSALSLMGVTSRVDETGRNPILMIDGEAANDGGDFAVLPPIEIRVAAIDGTVTRYKLGTSSPNLGPGERFAFSSRLEVPRNGVQSVSVTFAE
jgi:hypothetical protein